MADDKKDDEKPVTRSDLDGFLTSLTAKFGGSERRALEQLGDETLQLRRKNQQLKQKLADAEKTKAPDGAVILTGDDAKAWPEYQKLGKPTELAKQIEDGKSATARAATLEQERVHGEAAGLVGFKPSVLTRLATSEGFTVEVKEEHVDGKAAKVPYAKKTGDDKAQPVKLTEFAEQHLKDFLPALTADDASDRSSGPRKGGDPYIPQRRETGTPGGGTSTEQVTTQKRATGAYSF